MSALVIDASVAVKALVSERGSKRAADLLECADPALAPQHILAECANALWKRVHRGLATPDDLTVPLRVLVDLPVRTVELRGLTAAALSIALEFDHPVYDCYYIAAAIQNDAALATADERLYDLAQRVGFGERAILVR
jgi:predicted nucleic acid-binding protein